MEETPATRPYLELADMAARKAKLQEKAGKAEVAALRPTEADAVPPEAPESPQAAQAS
jgi:hypothetical protein